ncbi:hypothetical protein [Rhodoplanes sp. Z2-YC6860]|uniref:hypothetical protein n=1 Tax=Rhodoplanes sp. Z2-YC6860 TaxID=674703 RepID=UPI000830DFED|nr:hypothetical protein [Rhodoplanes sp. Z2-YC6860]
MKLTRRMVLSLAAVVAARQAFAQDDDTVAFVRDFYTREIARHAAKEHQSDDDFLKVFTVEARELWRAAQENRGKANVPLGPIRHLFLGQGVLPGREVALGPVTASGHNAVAVELTVQGNPRQLVIRTAREGLSIKFADIDYGDGESFVAYFSRLAGRKPQ